MKITCLIENTLYKENFAVFYFPDDFFLACLSLMRSYDIMKMRDMRRISEKGGHTDALQKKHDLFREGQKQLIFFKETIYVH